MWPAFWGRLVSGKVKPLAPEYVKHVMAKAKIELTRAPDGNWPTLDSATLTKVLGLLGADAPAEGMPVYVAGGKLHRLDGERRVATEEHRAAQPYLWPMAHDVRPAALALGAKGCQDCHDAGAPMLSGQVPVDSPLAADRRDLWRMLRFQKNLDAMYVADMARSFRYRTWMKVSVVTAASVLLLFALTYALAALGRVSAATYTFTWTRVSANLIGALLCGASAWSGIPALMSGEKLTGYRLMIHAGAAPLFAAGAVLTTLFWAHRNRFGRPDWNRVRWPLGRSSRHGANPYVVVLRKAFFWVALSAAIPAVASAILAMFPVLASIRQPMLFQLHRYAVGTLIVSASGFVACGLVVWLTRGAEGPSDALPQVSRS